jgi:DNA-binding PadR family transcriptional regulator
VPPSADRPSAAALIVLTMLAERPLHPYALHKSMEERGKTSIVRVTRAGLYQLLDRLVRAGLVERGSVEHSGTHPDRTVHRLTEAGGAAARTWLLAYLAAGSDEPAGFVAALSSIALVAPAEALASLRRRRERLAEERDAAEAEVRLGADIGLPRLFQLDEDYRLRQLTQDLAWLDGLVGELESGDLAWDAEYVAAVAARMASGGGAHA